MVINKRPIAIRQASVHDYYAITPSDLLLGRATGTLRKSIHLVDWTREQETGAMVPPVLGKIEIVVEAWWNHWHKHAFQLLFPRRKWQHERRNAQVGDIVLLHYDSKIHSHYRLARVVETFPDKHGVVRTVKIVIRDRRGTAKEPTYTYKTKKDAMRVGVQRIVTILPVEEQGSPSPRTVATGARECPVTTPQEGN